MPAIQVAVAVIQDQKQNVLIAKRKLQSHMGGKWEFPGGKIEADENIAQALERELCEELDIIPLKIRPLIKLYHEYPDKAVLLDVWWVDEYSGIPKGNEGQEIKWCQPQRMVCSQFPDANVAIINAIKLPDYYCITPDLPSGSDDQYLQAVEQAMLKGARLIQLRCPQYSQASYLALAEKVLSVCRSNNVQLILNAAPSILDHINADGLHLNSRSLAACTQRPLPNDQWLSASCHSINEIQQAKRIGVDFISLSPVQQTPSHKDAIPLGWAQFEALCASSGLPVYALGGMQFEDLLQAQYCGARGIAGIRFCQDSGCSWE